MNTLIIGTGYVGTLLGHQFGDRRLKFTQTSRMPSGNQELLSNGAQLDRLLGDVAFDQIVFCAQLTAGEMDWVLERIDGPRWLVFSSQQVTSSVPAPRTDIALAREAFALVRGACVIRPTMIFGHGGDKNISFASRLIQRWHVGPVPGPGTQLVQPVHVDDVIDLVVAHSQQPISGLFAVGGPEAIPIREVVEILIDVVGGRARMVTIPTSSGLLRSALGLARLRPDQLGRLAESKTADIEPTMRAFNWKPAPLAIRLEQAVREL